MTANIGALRAPRQVSPWIVIGAAAALIAALAVLTVSERSAVTPTREPAVTAARTNEAAEMVELKSAVVHRYMVERFAIDESSPVVNEQALEGATKARLAHGWLQARPGVGGNPSPEGRAAFERANQTRLEQGWFRR